MSNFFKKYLPFTGATLQTFVTYRLNFFFFMSARLLRVFVTLYLWQAIYKSSGKTELMNFSMIEMIIYIVISDLIANVIMSSNALETIPNEVRSGLISMSLIKPINYHFQILFLSLGNLINVLLYYILPLFIILTGYLFFAHNILPPGIGTIVLFIFSCLISYLIYFFFTFMIATISFFTTSIWGISVAMFAIVNFLSGRMIPIDFFSGYLRIIIQYMPFSSMIYTPVMIYSGKLIGNDMLIMMAVQISWLIIIWGLSMFIWKQAIKKLTILGG
ncbi:MAG: hypothetical protein A2355_07020 [Spirochaetes bacterium RIFOXYB1_FULL_32_8]|nr:MAG: hypothetical protein A2Y30_13430 [Spirochaetes bacterium GWE1_32_154]OHD49967.1 MAG: hypothetical protein A2Y29_11475 [Spirochaetes bacterium GWE2_31_10]OHD72978.1 MAG: hypothetical protein A2355_07020 [Spirochaetes bacterium RIFOXYB1_FULL_32_8]HBI38427.1 hypothetical protein [Spirochaetia bacterium]